MPGPLIQRGVFEKHVSDASSLVHRIRAEYREMPGLRLTLRQAARLWHLDARTCELVFEALVGERFLLRTSHGAFVRAEHP